MKTTLKAFTNLRDAQESARKRSLFANLKSGKPENYEVRRAPDGRLFCGHMLEFGEVAWPLVVGYANGYRYDD